MKREGIAPKAVYSVVKIVGSRLIADPPRKTVALSGKVKVVGRHEPFWGTGKDFEMVLESPTYNDLLRAASKQIKVTGDWHHVYFEGFRLITGSAHELTIELVMGS